PNRIKLAYHGVGDVRENAKGQLEVKTPAGNFHDDTPVAWQEIAGKRTNVALRYQLERKNTSAESYTYGFSIGKHDKNQPLILDPAVIVYCGFIGGSDYDVGVAIAVDDSGCAYVTGQTNEPGIALMLKTGPDLTHNGGREDAFVAKIKADGTGLIYCGFIGGAGSDIGMGIGVDALGCAYVGGYSNSTQSSFPVKVGPCLTFNGGQYDAFVAKVNASGTGLNYCGYIGGSGKDVGIRIAVDVSGFAYLIGDTAGGLPTIAGPGLTYNGVCDVFVAKVNADGSGLIYCGYIGGTAADSALGITVDALGCAYLTGVTSSTETQRFPLKAGPGLAYRGGQYDGFAAKVKADGTGLVYCGYIGGAGYEEARWIAADTEGCAYVAGFTSSTETTFPVRVGPDLNFNGGPYDSFLAKIKADGTGLVYCGYIGGTGDDRCYGVAVDASGYAYVTGYTDSSEISFPVLLGPSLIKKGGQDAYVAKVKADGTDLIYCGYMGGSSFDCGYSIAVDKSGCAYVTGETASSDFPMAVGPVLIHGGGSDAFIAKISNYNSYTVNFLAGTGGTLTGDTPQIVAENDNSSPVIAVPNTGYRFVNWTGTGGFVSTQNPLTVTNVTSDMTVTANFASASNSPGWTPVQGLQYNMIIYGKAYKANTCPAVGDWIGAFGPGGISDCRGLSRIGANGSYYLTIRSNASSGETISFKLWPLPSGPSTNAAETICFTADEKLADFPLHFGALEQKFNLVSGWNWISFNVLPANTSLNSVFASLAGVAEQIKSQNKATIYINGNWVGDLTNMNGIADGIMYKIKVCQPCAFTVNGMPIPFNKPLRLVTNWNWIAYLPAFPEPLEKALCTIIPQLDQVKSQIESAVKIGSSFIGDLTQMEPTKGYLIKMNAPATLVYPYGSVSSSGKSGKVTHPPTPSVPWKMIKGNQYNMIAHGNVYINGKPVNGKDYYLIGLGPGGDSDCRSISPVGNGGSFFATILGNTNGETVRFKLYNSKNASTINTGSPLVFKADELKANLVVSF
ncbi:MAG: SBBP repeat-containing protein, partial [Candidatus Omnitrophota bacterium]